MTTQISANYSLEDIYVNEVEIVEVGHDKINFKATGSITAGLQWGSNSDVRRGDRLVREESFSFTGRMWSPVVACALIQVLGRMFIMGKTSGKYERAI